MKVYYQLDQLPSLKNTVLTIGSFDGVHHGHQQLLERINGLAKQVGGQSLVVTFHPHPRQVIYPNDKSLALLTTIEEKVALFGKYGVDNVVVVPFTIDFSRQSADEYIQNFLVDLFHPSYIVIGYDHKFGQNRAGDIHYLKKHGEQLGFKVIEIAPQEVDDIAVSSTKIRNALKAGKIKEANDALGHCYQFSGTVVKGQQLGRQLGYPTANILPDNEYKLVPPFGIYAAKVIYKGTVYNGMLYVGDRPSINGINEQSIEINIFDFDFDIYGELLTIQCIDFIRSDIKFNGLEELKKQLAKDELATKAILDT